MNGLYYPNAKYDKNDIVREENYNYSFEDLFKYNIGKKIRLFLSFPNVSEIRSFEGVLEKVSNEYLIISNPTSNKWQVLLLMYIIYAEFDEDIK